MLIFGSSAVSAAFYDFLITILVELISIALFILLTRTEFFKHYAGEDTGEKSSLETLEKKDLETKSSLADIYKKIWVWILAVFITFVTVMSIFPAITSQVVSTGSGARYVVCSFGNSLDIDQKTQHSIFSGTEWHNKYFIPVGCFLLLHIGEFVGSTMASFIKWPKNTHIGSTFILALALLRIVFIPLLLFCNIAPKQRFVTSVSNIMYLNVMFASKQYFCFYLGIL